MADDPETRFLPEAFKARRDKRKKAAEQKAPPARPTAPAPQPTSQPAQQYANDGAEFDDVSEYEDAGEGDGANEFGDDAAGYEFDQDNAPAPAPARADNKVEQLSSRVERLMDKLDEMQRENADLRRQLTKQADPPEPPAPRKPRIELNIEGSDVDDGELNREFPTLLPTVRAIARREIKVALEALAPQLDRLFDQTEQEVGSVKQAQQGIVRSTFERSLHTSIPDLPSINSSQKFQQYIDQQAPMHRRGTTIRDVLSYAYRNQDVDTIVEVIAAYKAVNPSARQATRQVSPQGTGYAEPTVEQFIQPTTPRQGVTQVRDAQAVRKLKQSDWNNARRRLMHGELSAAEYTPIKAKFEKAKSEGRLFDDTAPLSSSA